MKRKIGLIIILSIEIIIGVLYNINSVWDAMSSAMPFLSFIESWISNFVDFIKDLLAIPYFKDFEEPVKDWIVWILLNIVFILLYSLIFGIIALIQKNIRRKKYKQAHNNQGYILTDEEKARFEWKLYVTKFPTRRLISLIIPTFFMMAFVIIRYDTNMCEAYDLANKGSFTLFYDIKSYIGDLGVWLETTISKYIVFNNQIFTQIKVTWVEYILIGLVYILICLLWWGLFSIFIKPIRKSIAKGKARRAKNRFIVKMEALEYKALKKAEKELRVSKKNKDLYASENFINDVGEDVKAIATPLEEEKNNKDSKKKEPVSVEQDYIDDISTGVTDLGLVEEDNSELQEPISVREQHFVGDEEVDIVLEEEPIIETIEEEEAYYNDVEENEESFERYQPEALDSFNIEDKIKKYNIDVIEENQEVEYFNEDDAPVIQEFEEKEIEHNNKEEIPVEEEHETQESQTLKIITDKKDKKIIKPVIPVQKDLGKAEKKPIKPIDLNKDRKKIVEYIINVSNSQNSDSKQEKNDEIQDESKKAKPLHPIKPKKDIKPIEIRK